MKQLLVLIGILSFTNVFGQKEGFGVKAGLNISTIILKDQGEWPLFEHFPEDELLYAFHSGAFYSLKVSKKFYFQPEIQYSVQGKLI